MWGAKAEPMARNTYNWQQKGWPKATVNRAALKEELGAFCTALRDARKFLKKPQDPEAVARAGGGKDERDRGRQRR